MIEKLALDDNVSPIYAWNTIPILKRRRLDQFLWGLNT
jgi:hypothetical protein